MLSDAVSPGAGIPTEDPASGDFCIFAGERGDGEGNGRKFLGRISFTEGEGVLEFWKDIMYNTKL